MLQARRRAFEIMELHPGSADFSAGSASTSARIFSTASASELVQLTSRKSVSAIISSSCSADKGGVRWGLLG